LSGYRIRSAKEDTVKETIPALKEMANETRNDKIMIMDARRATLTLLRPVYNRVITLNRRDFAKFAYPVVIADGPSEFLKPGKSLSVFTTYLMDLKTDFVQSLYFYDPLIHFLPFETEHMSMDEDWKITEKLPERLKKELIGKKLVDENAEVKVKHIRKHFRGLKEGRINDALKQKRMAELMDIYSSLLAQAFPNDPKVLSWPTKEGYLLEGYGPMYMYPFFFEQLVADLLDKK
jgi:hypothetical protein